MNAWSLFTALVGPYLGFLLGSFLVEAARAFPAPKPAPYTPAELHALVRREFAQAPIPDDFELRIAAALLEGQS